MNYLWYTLIMSVMFEEQTNKLIDAIIGKESCE